MKKPIKTVKLPSGETKIICEGKEYLVPKEIAINDDKGDWFVDGVRDYITEAARPYQQLHLLMVGKKPYKLSTTRTATTFYCVILTADSNPIGWAEFKTHGAVFQELFAAITTAFQRKGIYSSLIKYLKKRISPVILSDKSLTVSNALRWMKTGSFDKERGRYRANPRPKRPGVKAIKLAVASLFTRAYTR